MRKSFYSLMCALYAHMELRTKHMNENSARVGAFPETVVTRRLKERADAEAELEAAFDLAVADSMDRTNSSRED